MKPPICEICDVRFDPRAGGLVTFAPTPRSEEWRARAAREPGFVGHPPDQGWFCPTHLSAAHALADRTLPAALEEMRSVPGHPGPDDPVATPLTVAVGCAPISSAELHRVFVELAGVIVGCLGGVTTPTLERTSSRRWNEMDGSVAPDCPYVDDVRDAGATDDVEVEITRSESWWNPAEIANATVAIWVRDRRRGVSRGGIIASSTNTDGTSVIIEELSIGYPIVDREQRALEAVLDVIGRA